MRNSSLNPDKYFLIILSILVVLILLYSPDSSLIYSLGLIFSLIIYEILIYPYRIIYGITGIKVLAMPSIAFISFTVLIAIPAIYVASVNSGPYSNMFMFSILSFYIFYPMGLYLGNYFHRINCKKINLLSNMSFSNSRIDIIIYEGMLILLFTSLLIFILYLLRVETIPLFLMLTDSKSYLSIWMVREESMKLLNVTFIEKYFFAWLRDIFIPLGIISCLFLVVQYQKRKYFIIFSIFLLLGIINNSLTIAKAPTAALFLAITAFIFIKSKKVSLKFIFISLIIIFSFPYLVIHLVTPPEFRAPSNLLNSLFLRVFVVPAEALYQYYEVFPSKHEFLLGKGSKLFSWLHSEGLFNAANYVAKIWWSDPTTTGNANANYLGTFWADFGWYGVIISTILIGYIIHLFYWKLIVVSDYKKNIIYVSISSISVMMMSFTFISGNFTTIILTRGLLIMFLFVSLIQQIEKKYAT